MGVVFVITQLEQSQFGELRVLVDAMNQIRLFVIIGGKNNVCNNSLESLEPHNYVSKIKNVLHRNE